MKHLIRIMFFAALTITLFIGCSKSPQPAGEAQQEKAPAPEAVKSAQPPADSAQEAEKGAQPAAGGAEASAAQDEKAAPFDDENPMIGQMKYSLAIMAIIEKNIDDCEKAGKLVNDFHEQHRAKLEEMRKKAEEMQKNANPQMMIKFGMEAQKYGPEIAKKQPVLQKFQENCVAQYAAIKEAIEATKKKAEQ